MKVENNRISVVDFVKECKDDINSPTTSTFSAKIALCRNTVSGQEEVLDTDRSSLKKFKSATKEMYSSGISHVHHQQTFVDNLQRLGNNECNKSVHDTDPDIGSAFLRLSCYMRSVFNLFQNLVSDIEKNITYPLDNILKGDLKGVKGDMKRPFDKSWKDYDTKVKHVEREKRQLAKEAGMIRGEISGSEIAEEMERERRMFQLQMCEYLIKANEIKTRKEVELLQHLLDFYECQNTFFSKGLKLAEQLRAFTDKLTSHLKTLRQEHDDEKKQLQDLRSMLRASFSEKDERKTSGTVYNLHQMEGNRQLGNEKEGYLQKKSEGRVRKTWQKRKCCVKEGYLTITHHNLSTKPPVKLNLLTSQLKPVPEDKRQFDLVSHKRSYRFMAETETEALIWTSVIQNSKLDALNQVFGSDRNAKDDSGLKSLTRAIIKEIKRRPGNDKCCDCTASEPTWLSTNLGVLLCIECSGIHREMGVHISRIQSITLDDLGTSDLLLARSIGNGNFNDILEENLDLNLKPIATSDMEERKLFIRGKYIDHKYVIKSCGGDARALSAELNEAIRQCNLLNLLQVFAEEVSLTSPLPGHANQETALHAAVTMATSEGPVSVLPLIDFLSQNIGSQGLNLQTSTGDTALHICAYHKSTECMKLLLRSRANTEIENNSGERAIDVAKRLNHVACIELLNEANSSKFKSTINIDIDWNLNLTDDENDFISDDELEDKNVPLQPPAPIPNIVSKISQELSQQLHFKERSKSDDTQPVAPVRREPPPVPAHGNRTRSHTSSRTSLSPTPPLPEKPTFVARKLSMTSSAATGDNKSRPPPLPPSKPALRHRTNDVTAASQPQRSPVMTPDSDIRMRIKSSAQHTDHRRLPSNGSNAIPVRCKSFFDDVIDRRNQLSGRHSVLLPTSDNAVTNQMTSSPAAPSRSVTSSLYHRNPPSGPPGSYSLPRSAHPSEMLRDDPPSRSKPKRVRAIWDCDADREDELTFVENEVIVVTGYEDSAWWFGHIEHQLHRSGAFPSGYVVPINE